MRIAFLALTTFVNCVLNLPMGAKPSRGPADILLELLGKQSGILLDYGIGLEVAIGAFQSALQAFDLTSGKTNSARRVGGRPLRAFLTFGKTSGVDCPGQDGDH